MEQIDEVKDGQTYLLYRANELRTEKPLFLRDNRLYEARNQKLKEYTWLKVATDVLVSAPPTDDLAAAIALDADIRSIKKAAEEQALIVRNHPLYINLASKAKEEQERWEKLELELLASEKLWGVDSILTLNTECLHCFGSLTFNHDYDWSAPETNFRSPCFICNDKNYYEILRRLPGEDRDWNPESIADGGNFRKVFKEALAECKARGDKHVYYDETKRRIKIR